MIETIPGKSINEITDKVLKILSKSSEEHGAYHKLATKKKKGRPKIKRKRGRQDIHP